MFVSYQCKYGSDDYALAIPNTWFHFGKGWGGPPRSTMYARQLMSLLP